ncbi:hypothetical protein BVX98_04375 [bacterium F11]|nr:hypothetical protein BVX98_04375 [bacterium F11]
MKENILTILRCPKCSGHFQVLESQKKNGEIHSGKLGCQSCQATFPIRNYIPRIIEDGNYSESYGKLWCETGHLLRDSETGVPFHYNIVYGQFTENGKGIKDGYSPFGFEWPKQGNGEWVLEVGSGPGALTEALIKSGAEVVSIDMSYAVDSMPEDLLIAPNLNVVQADINQPFLKEDMFDRILLIQVLQHTPSPKDTLKRLRQLLKPQGELAFTCYSEPFEKWYYPITKRLNLNLSWSLILHLVPIFVPLKYHLQKFFLKIRLPIFARIVNKLLEPFDARNLYFQTLEGKLDSWVYGAVWNKTKDKKLFLKYVALNTFDCITPWYTNSGTHKMVEEWSHYAGFESVKTWGTTGVRARAIK